MARRRSLILSSLAGFTALAAVLAACGSSGGSGTTNGSPPRPGGVAPGGNTTTGAAANTDWPKYHLTVDRHGNATSMPSFTHARALTRITLDGAVYASPIVARGLTIVATENDTVYAFDRSYKLVWKKHLGTPTTRSQLPCGNISPLGITGTPIYDYTTGLVYLAPEFGPTPRHALVALKLTTGAVAWQRSLDLPGVQTSAMQERGALNISGGRVWVPFGGLAGDCGNYKGRVIGVPRTNSGSTVSYTVPTAREAGIWTPPGVVVDSAGSLYVAVGNGASGPGDRYDHSDSVLRLTTSAKLADSFSPSTWASDNASDLDLGSQGPTLVGSNWVFTAGKSGTVYVLRRTHLGGIGGQVSKATICRSFGGTAVNGSVVYVPCTDGVRAVSISSTGTMKVLWHASSSVAGSPSIGGGRVWSLDTGAGVLHALNAGTGASVASVRVGATSRFAAVAITGRDVLVPTLTGLTVVRTS